MTNAQLWRGEACGLVSFAVPPIPFCGQCRPCSTPPALPQRDSGGSIY